MVDLRQLETKARDKLQPRVHGDVARGVGDSLTFDRNLEAWRRLELAPYVLTGAAVADTHTTVLGSEVSTPVLLAPAGLPRNAHGDQELRKMRRSPPSLSMPDAKRGRLAKSSPA